MCRNDTTSISLCFSYAALRDSLSAFADIRHYMHLYMYVQAWIRA